MYAIETVNFRLTQSPTHVLGYGVVTYKSQTQGDDSTVVVPMQEDENGTFSFWTSPAGEICQIKGFEKLLDERLLRSAKHGKLGRDSKGARYGSETVSLALSDGSHLAVRAVFLPQESSEEADSYRFIGNLRYSRFTPMKFGVIR